MAIVKKYQARIINIKNEINGVYTLEFESLGKPFNYAPGQFLHLAMDEDYDGSGQWPESRCFSMQSNPLEENIQITYAVKGNFTRQIEKSLSVGSEVWLKLPYGDLFQQAHNKLNTVFIAGGTGVTPFLSLFTHESFLEYVNPVIYLGFRTRDYNLYEKEILQIKNASKKLTCIYENADGLLNIHKIFHENSVKSNYFISGPPAMITSFKRALIELDVPEDNVLTDDWE